jgi:hypothetical protein
MPIYYAYELKVQARGFEAKYILFSSKVTVLRK